jgi:prepilin-type N-terminal cleavage/methylation domain-containing protein
MTHTDSKNCTSPGPAPRSRRGFTVIEMLIVVAVLGILAAIAIPQLSGAKEQARVAAMIADLRLAAIHEEIYATENNGEYFSGTASAENAVEGFRTSPGITVTLTAFARIGRTPASWVGVARHAGSDKRCELTGGAISCDRRIDWTIGQVASN